MSSGGGGGGITRDHYHKDNDCSEAHAMENEQAQDGGVMVGKYRLGGIIGKGLSSEVRDHD